MAYWRSGMFMKRNSLWFIPVALLAAAPWFRIASAQTSSVPADHAETLEH